MLTPEEIVRIDQAHCWHPYSSLINPPPLFPVESASGVRFKLMDGRELIDGMASWWCVIHGYNHPRINEAITHQVEQMSHVMFGGLTHEPAARLVKHLVDLTPEGLTKVFLADSGSVSVEVAIKMAIQYWNSQQKPEKHRLITVRNGYHGDTFGAMAVCDPVNGMHHLFSAVLPQNIFAPAPPMGYDRQITDEDLSELRELFERHHHELAAMIIEPIVQGAGGMRIYSPQYLKAVRELCDEFDVLLIADEIATGFGRTGKMFGCDHADICPDIMTVGKSLSAGYMTLAATLCTDRVADGICRGEAGVFMHGPTFMGNPLACSVANVSIELLLEKDWQADIARIEGILKSQWADAMKIEGIRDVRIIGAIGVIEMEEPVDMAVIQPRLVEEGIWLRPFGRLIYTMPPYVISDEDLIYLCQKTLEVIREL
ncbi:adenosylmethionine--8-amino-7-oxononanoate transaminase [Hahella ganghwensis]|uniref:adenosylmethionine--8-amino-7-oxononanoate transaminase n=1 Tax=Hahella ganghwensis TaxID=286420 RepID=UPI000371C79C|nr:adenosylmethionine--8-amino-7-oxononanoate transaminase [Hahella ganghwensis]